MFVGTAHESVYVTAQFLLDNTAQNSSANLSSR